MAKTRVKAYRNERKKKEIATISLQSRIKKYYRS